jgi:hypothetical protein
MLGSNYIATFGKEVALWKTAFVGGRQMFQAVNRPAVPLFFAVLLVPSALIEREQFKVKPSLKVKRDRRSV